MHSEGAALVVDNGSCMCKVGYAGQKEPEAVFPTAVGRPTLPDTQYPVDAPVTRIQALANADRGRGTCVGNEVYKHLSTMTPESPMDRGVVSNWVDMEMIWAHMFNDVMQINPGSQPVLLTEAPLNPKVNRELMMEVMFETFNVPAMHVALPAVLSLTACGRMTGVVLDVGDTVSHVVPIFEGFAIDPGMRRLEIGGSDLTDYLARLVSERGYSLDSAIGRATAREIKEQQCFVSMNYEADMRRISPLGVVSSRDNEYQLPDGQVISLGTEVFRCPEALFRPSHIGREASGLPNLLFESILKCEVDQRRALYESVLLSGGSTLFPNMPERMRDELMNLVPASMKVKVLAPPERAHSAWLGGSIMAEMSTFQQSWVTRSEFNECGPAIAHGRGQC
mmetsp:Transcript_24758/g.45370  ORF Transcript_24758/g.45370 Transcript_24758/m.45370 type:complete len:394 (+) Transcript_24758:80-1261(+)